jgi:hypothetical protein
VRHLFINTGRLVAVLAISTVVITSTSLAGASSKPSGDLVPRGAHVLTLSGSPTVAVGASPKIITVTRSSVIARVRSLINSLPITSNGNQMCPDDMLVPSTVSFKKTLSSTPFTKVVFQLGGCPSARVYQLGDPETPTLGGPNLSSVYSQIKSLIDATT